jgi:RHS repeat-associated protein
LFSSLKNHWYDYGARYYDPAVARWHSIDPLAETYDSWSPYHYALNNPIRFTDVFGMGAGDFYDENGKFLGTDGVDDGKKYVVTDKQEKKEIKSTNKEGGTTQVSDVSSSKQLPSDAALSESLNVLERTEANGGLREESSKVMTDGTVARGKTGEMPTIKDGVQTAKATLPGTPAGKDVEATIHSHPTKVQIEGDKAYPQTATNPSGQDESTFKNYGINIIVGNLSQPSVTKNTDGTYVTGSAAKGAVIYNSKTQPQIQLTEKAIKRILK